MGGSYELVEKLWAQFILTAGRVNAEVSWTRVKVVVNSVNFRSNFISIQIYIVFFLLLVDILIGMLLRFMSRVVAWPQAYRSYRMQFEERGVTVWIFMRTWENDTFSSGCRGVSDQFFSGAAHELSVIGSAVAAVSGSPSYVAVFVGSNMLVDVYGDYLGSGYDRKLVGYPIVDLRLLKGCLWKASLTNIGSLDPLSMTEFNVTRLRRAEHHEWMMSPSGLCRAIVNE